jgi:hypothetical protein
MHIHFLFLIFVISHSITMLAMDLGNTTKSPVRNIPKLYNVCMESISSGFGKNNDERYKNALQNLAKLNKIHKNGKSQQYPYPVGSDEINIINKKIFPDHDPEFMQVYAKRIYPDISTPFMIQHDKDWFYIKDNRTDIALFNIQTGEKKTVFKGTSFIRSCAQNKSTGHLYIGTHDEKIYELNIDHHNSENTNKKEIFFTESMCSSPITHLIAHDDYLCCSQLGGSTYRWGGPAYLIDITRKKGWIYDAYQQSLAAEKERAVTKAINAYRWQFFCPTSTGEIRYEVAQAGNEEWIYNKILEQFDLMYEKKHINLDLYPYVLLDNTSRNITAIAAHDNLVYLGNSRGGISLFDIRSDNALDMFDQHTGLVSCLITSQHNDHIFYSGGMDGFINVYDLRKLSRKQRTIESQKDAINCMYESNNEKALYSRIYSGGTTNGVRIYDFNTATTDICDPYQNKKIRSVYAFIDNKVKKISLQYVDCITTNEDESELYISNVPTGITVLSPDYGLEEFADDITIAEQEK